ncbi:MAG: TetR/AcrR family transcriptional regulator [Bacillota bacterium]|nr:TetR/AcrR family transcriptional regulator [Bacillota bacterium]MDW7684762.1 TetR/AcrR family transcriptional regulator [Bacillota bacterium]
MDDKRIMIIKAARQLLEEGGQVTIDKVAAAAGVAKGTVYLYFDSKLDLIRQTFLNSIEELYTAVDSAAVETAGSSFERISAMVECHYKLSVGKVILMQRIMAEEPEMMRNMHRGVPHNVIRSIQRIEKRYEQELARGMESGEFRPHQTEIIAAALMSMIQNLSVGKMFGRQLDEEKIVPEVLKMVLTGIAAQSGLPTKQEEL